MRLFLGCPISDDISTYLHTIADLLPESKQTIPKNFDLTLKFLGNVTEPIVEQIKEKIASLTFSPFTGQLDGLHIFSERLFRIVWVGLTSAEKITHLHHMLDNTLFPLFPKDTRFQPHLTISRIKSIKDKTSFLNTLTHIHVEPKPLYINKIILYASHITEEGALHTPILEIPAKKIEE